MGASRPTSPGRSAAQRYATGCFGRRSSATTRPATPIAVPADSTFTRSTVASKGTTQRCSTAIAMHAGAVSSSRDARPIPIGGLAAWTEEAVLERMEARLAARPEILKQRREIAEHPFGSIKQWMSQGTFLLRGLEKVRAEFSLTALAYNFIRVVNIVGVASLLKAV